MKDETIEDLPTELVVANEYIERLQLIVHAAADEETRRLRPTTRFIIHVVLKGKRSLKIELTLTEAANLSTGLNRAIKQLADALENGPPTQ